MQTGVTVVLGGAASGKSAFAEELTLRHDRRMTYLATSRVLDEEMRKKVADHAARRGAEWSLVEEPMEPGAVLAGLGAGEVVLLDCATMWLSNHLMAGSDLGAAQARLLTSLEATEAAVVVVTNEVGAGIVPDNPLARRFRDAQGRLNIALAAQADRVVQVVAGLPNVLKGALP
ncbi:MAG TPA: bifunctional adenosylcobinamide kinase/adenosylcobinamide-phosphate guanylyltransferase [Rhodobacteraceae bacterium]|nr:bifunctional adenosylcobinamide kinase/adenosylcobinamide-phosphate guanylyltransferase [Paracoccaceae bacterium]